MSAIKWLKSCPRVAVAASMWQQQQHRELPHQRVIGVMAFLRRVRRFQA